MVPVAPLRNSRICGLRIQLDLWYVENAALALDMLILIKTPFEIAGKQLGLRRDKRTAL